ncbi:ClpA/ClpB-like protein [Nocardiopsis sp. Huas11]|uniref:Clp protease N-terminal domain-containing protein n=1 Tax=Nocardiopsis sp. Huas11 TaxID=2183912 RepID=UPI000EAC9ED4|nr:Clp protease N-terminal domain-containing protein [Nocardiopsis sp. Huas11]RKS08776.1 ClpA/ClpB-like protein [Nocardiopsis sp. Huas11]
MFERFTKHSRDTVRDAVALVTDRGEDKVAPEHLLLALAAQEQSTAARILHEHGVTTAELDADGEAAGPAGLTDEEVDALKAVGVDTDAVFARMREAFGPDALRPDPAARKPRKRGRLGGAFDADAKKILELSLREAIALEHRGIDTGHILLALLRHGLSASMATVLTRQGLTYDAARERVRETRDEAA